MFKTPVSVFIAFGLLTISLSFKINTEVKDGEPNGNQTASFLKLGNGLYYIELKLGANWFVANDHCHAMDAELISFQTIEEWNMINKYLADQKIENNYWTAGYDLGEQGRHVWISTGQPIIGGLWARGQPDNYKGIENCDELGSRRTANDYRGLNDAYCLLQHLYICERPLLKTTSVEIKKIYTYNM